MSADLSRFHATNPAIHAAALAEVTAGRKQSHWMWFVFPQLRGLGHSAMAERYGLDPDEAAPFLADPLLGPRLLTITRALMAHAGRMTAVQIFGPVDAQKLRSSMTLFAAVPGADPVFDAVLDAFFATRCPHTLSRLNRGPPAP